MDKLEWAELWAAMKANPGKWIPTTEAMYWNQLEVLPPILYDGRFFLVGEASHMNEKGQQVYACFNERNGKYTARYMTYQEAKNRG